MCSKIYESVWDLKLFNNIAYDGKPMPCSLYMWPKVSMSSAIGGLGWEGEMRFQRDIISIEEDVAQIVEVAR